MDRSRLPLPLWWGFVLLTALLLFSYRYLDRLARGDDVYFLVPFIEEFTAVFAAGLLFFPIRRMARRFPLTWATWGGRVPLHAAALVIFSVTHTSLNWGTRTVLFAVAGLGTYDYGIMPVRYAMELPIDVILYTLFVSGVWIFDMRAAGRARELHAARLEQQLSQAQLQNLRLQLQPHFLFNALNTVSSVMYEDPAAADTMLGHLSELLRVSLQTAETQEVPLAEELEALDHYLALMRARFGDRLQADVEVEPAARAALVPSLILQPLVENAVRHGRLARAGRGRIGMRAAREGDRLAITVEDDGPGVAPGAAVLGVGRGLTGTAARLRLLYGDDHRFDAGNRAAGGFRVAIGLPFRPAPAGAPPPSSFALTM